MGLYSHTALCVRRFYEQRSSGSILQFLTRWLAYFDIALHIATATYLLCAKGSTSGLMPTCFESHDTTASSVAEAAASSTTRLLGEGILRGFGQVFLADGLLSSALVLAAMVLGHDFSSGPTQRSRLRAPKVAFAAIGGSFLGTLIAVSPSLMGASPTVASLGLWSYNALLGAAALSGGVMDASLATSALCAISCAVVGGAMATALTPLGGMLFSPSALHRNDAISWLLVLESELVASIRTISQLAPYIGTRHIVKTVD